MSQLETELKLSAIPAAIPQIIQRILTFAIPAYTTA